MQIWLKKTIFGMTFYCFRYDFSVALISALALLKYPSLTHKMFKIMLFIRTKHNMQTLTETVFLSNCQLNILESILIECCQCSSTSAASAIHPS